MDGIYEVLGPMVGGGTDLTKGLDVVSSSSLMDEEVKSRTGYHYLFDMMIGDEKLVAPVHIAMCGQVPRYTEIWDEIEENLCLLEGMQIDDPRYQDAFDAVVQNAQILADLIFVHPPEGRIIVNDVRREPVTMRNT
jgi:hypothetical protein